MCKFPVNHEARKSDLQLVIAHLKAERKVLKQMIRDASAEGDHLIVHYHHEALSELDNRLDVLCAFSDPLYTRKQQLERYLPYAKHKILIYGNYAGIVKLIFSKGSARG